MDVSLNLWFQSWRAWLCPVMLFFSELGTERFYMLVMPLFFWCVDIGLGLRLAVLLLLSNALNFYLKLAFHMPRPFWVSEQVQAFSIEESFGLPSGHAQNAASLWGLVVLMVKRKWVRWGLVAVIFLIGLSRIYLGVHFVGDVVAGWLVGAILLWGFLQLEPSAVGFWRRMALWQKITFALLSSLAILAVGWGIRMLLSNWTLPAAWLHIARKNANLESLNPINLGGLVSVAGTWLGALAGVGLYGRYYGEYHVQGSLGRRLIRYVIGLAGLLFLYLALGQAFALFESIALSFVLRYLRYALIGAWVTFVAPVLFRIL